MPTYLNASDRSIVRVETIDNREETVNTGDTIETRRYYAIPYLTLVSHEPYYKTVAVSEREVLSSTVEFSLNVYAYSYISFFVDSTTQLKYNNNPDDTQILYAGAYYACDNTNKWYDTLQFLSLNGGAVLNYDLREN